MASSTRVDPNPNKIYLDKGLELINAYINEYKSSSAYKSNPVPLSNDTPSNDTIYKQIETDLKKLKGLGNRYMINNVDLSKFVDQPNTKTDKDVDQSNTKTDKNVKKLLKIIKILLDILKPYSLVDYLRTGLFTSNIYDKNKLPTTEKKRIQVLLHKSLIEGDSNIDYITNIITNHRNSFLDIERLFTILSITRIDKKNSPELKTKLDELIEKKNKPLVLPVAVAGTATGAPATTTAAPGAPATGAPATGAPATGGKGGKSKKINKRSKLKKQKIHRNKTSKL